VHEEAAVGPALEKAIPVRGQDDPPLADDHEVFPGPDPDEVVHSPLDHAGGSYKFHAVIRRAGRRMKHFALSCLRSPILVTLTP
jgi:hypothetical protein